MPFNIDSAIFIGFLVANIVLGLASSRGIKTIKEYAIGDRNFSTATIAATIVATWISGEFFYSSIAEAYDKGLLAIWVATGDALCLLSIGIFFAPRMGEFLGKLSIAEAMGDLFGQRIRVITAVAGFIGSVGLIAIQLKMAGFIFEYALGLPSVYGIISATIIVTLYSALGGIKAVTFTDVIQFFTFGAVIPLIAYVILTSIDNVDIITNTLTNNPLFDYKKAFNSSNPLLLWHLFLFLLFIIVGFNPAIFQRVAMAKDTRQVGKSFIIAAIVCFLFAVIINWIAVLTLAINPSLNANDVIKYVIFNSPYVGLKGAMLIGVMAMIMSTVDSFINCTAVLIVHDFCKPLKIQFVKDELLSARIVSLLIGISSLAISLYAGNNLQELLVITYSFYMPIVIIPFTMAVFGFRSSEKSVLLGIVAGIITVLVWDYVLEIKAANSTIFGILANLIILMSSHYLLKQPGGWVGIKDNAPLIHIRNERKLKIKRFIHNIKSFNIIATCAKNCPQSEGLISILGLFVMITAFASTHTLAKIYQIQYKYLIDVLYPITLCASTTLITYPLWFANWKKVNLISVVWNITMFFVLVCFSLLMVLISQFAEIQLMVFMVNIIILSSLITWRWALFTIILGGIITTFFYQQYVPENSQNDLLSLEFKIVYLLLLIVSALVIFFKPKQEQQQLTEAKVDHLGDRILDREEELEKSQELKYEFLRNLQHEFHTPVTGIISLAQVLDSSYDKLSEEQRRDAIKTIAASAERFNSITNNLLDLSHLSSLTIQLTKTKVNLSELVHNRLDHCKKLYLNNKELEFLTDIEPDIEIDCDQHYITSTIDNLIINAIQYSKDGKITIKLTKTAAGVEFSIQDEGIGIPQNELRNIFGAFTVSSKTRTPAGGRGIGLALCEKAIKAHGGEISAGSDGKKGAVFKFNLPTSKS